SRRGHWTHGRGRGRGLWPVAFVQRVRLEAFGVDRDTAVRRAVGALAGEDRAATVPARHGLDFHRRLSPCAHLQTIRLPRSLRSHDGGANFWGITIPARFRSPGRRAP